MNEQKQDRTQTAINEAFGAEHGGDFTFELGEKNIFLAKPTPEECELYGLKQGEIVVVSDEGIYQLPREAFNAREQAIHGQWIEVTQEVYEAWDFDSFMERAGFFDSVAKAQAETTPERVAERAAEMAQFEEMYAAQKAQRDNEPPKAAGNAEEASAHLEQTDSPKQQRQKPWEAWRERHRGKLSALLPHGMGGHTRGGGRTR